MAGPMTEIPAGILRPAFTMPTGGALSPALPSGTKAGLHSSEL